MDPKEITSPAKIDFRMHVETDVQLTQLQDAYFWSLVSDPSYMVESPYDERRKQAQKDCAKLIQTFLIKYHIQEIEQMTGRAFNSITFCFEAKR